MERENSNVVLLYTNWLFFCFLFNNEFFIFFSKSVARAIVEIRGKTRAIK